jgi:hypothetical protein
MGLDNILTRQGVAAPTIFIAVGTVILLDNLNIVQWNVWQVILSLWPVLIVAIGLDLLVARRSIWGAVAGADLAGHHPGRSAVGHGLRSTGWYGCRERAGRSGPFRSRACGGAGRPGGCRPQDPGDAK